MHVRNDSSGSSLVAMLASCSPAAAVQAQPGGGGMEDTVSCGQKRPYYSTIEASGEDPGEEDVGDDCIQQSKKRRLTFDQVRSLEKNFEIENKLEPERKMQLANELGLQPRQVAVWFQNRRARWKTKQLERDYEVLTLDYNRLKSEFEAVLQEKQELQDEMECLTEKIQTAIPNSADPILEKRKRIISMSQPSSLKTFEGPVKSERIAAEVNGRNDALTPCKEEGSKEEGSKETSSDSISSEILNADSPRTMDSGSLLPLPDSMSTFSHVCTEMVDSNIIHMSDQLCDQMLSPQACQLVSVKIEDGSYQDDSCNYILTLMDSIEEKGLPWWDFP